jgi:hypothetical protein
MGNGVGFRQLATGNWQPVTGNSVNRQLSTVNCQLSTLTPPTHPINKFMAPDLAPRTGLAE